MTEGFLLVQVLSAVALFLLATATTTVEHLHPHVANYAACIYHSNTPSDALHAFNLPKAFDWRRVNGTNYCSTVSMQYSTPHCGSCWALATTGALSDRYIIATQGRLRIALSPQQLLNFNANLTGGTCLGGTPVKGYAFIHRYGISDDTCAPYVGHGIARGVKVAGMTEIEEVRAHQCYVCSNDGTCKFAPRESYNLYGADEFGVLLGEQKMMEEIYTRGPIVCRLYSDHPEFDEYRRGILNCVDSPHLCRRSRPNHSVVIAGWGVDKGTNMSYWVGRNGYGGQWGEGAGGGWFRLQRGVGALGMDKNPCAWAVPATADVKRALQQYGNSLAH